MSKTMRAYQQRVAGQMPEVFEVPMPEPGPGQVRMRTAGSGLCHSDLHVIHTNPSMFPLPLIIGHEPTGWVDAVGPGVKSVKEGDPYAIYFPWGCGRCHRCSSGEENICEGQTSGPGAGRDGGMADYILVEDVRHLVPLGTLDPVETAPLMCAGITTYHSVKSGLSRLLPGTTAVLIGFGGLGHIALQVIKALSPARVIAVDTNPDKLAHAKALGADEVVLAGPDAAAEIKRLTDGLGGAMVLDMVGIDSTMALGLAALARKGELKIIGAAGGSVPVTFPAVARDASIHVPYAGTIPELYEVLQLAAGGMIKPDVERVSFDGLRDAYDRLEHGQIRGRAVLVPAM